jgi:hypothetical protein
MNVYLVLNNEYDRKYHRVTKMNKIHPELAAWYDRGLGR